MASLFAIAFAVIIIYLLKYVGPSLAKYARHVWMTRNIPGPKANWLFGNILQFPKEAKDYRDYFLGLATAEMAKGNQVLRLWFLNHVFIYPLDSDAVRAITSSTVEINKGETYNFIQRWLGKGLITISNEPRWHKNRKLLTPAFHFGKLDEYIETIDVHSKHLIEVIDRKTSENNQIDLYPLIKLCALDVIIDAAMGCQINALENSEQDYVKAVHKFNHLAYIKVMKPYIAIPLVWNYCGYEADTQKALNVLKNQTKTVVEDRIKQRQEYNDTKPRPDFLDLLLNEYDKGEVSFTEICEEVDTFMFAGHDTTSHGIAWTLWSLACHPDIQETLYEELASNFDDKADLSSIKQKNLKYLDAVIKESLRMFPPVPFVQRELVEDLPMAGYTLPKGAQVTIAPYFMHHNQNVFPNHMDFDPNNFLGNKELESNAYIPFSSGMRNCIGQRLAQYEMKITIAYFVLNFKIEADKFKFHENWPSFEIILQPSQGVPVKIYKR
ncbi:unnamed protein product [Bursaphelenchus okinawaensis]|uniref:Uncharacterized protein n=1 Tax=Bursaphelenchus okinawaensis TaxID=465554 RepID=A0A811JWJ0_9BILA|nr:unnamed protein product [Bursaphelenchus okinawaensis]CAG9085828.1 unnamed protein product [Bursaphelenchus okinawaensis]